MAFTNIDYSKATTGVDDSSTPGVSLANDCSPQYQPNVTTDALSLVLDFIQGTVSNVFAVQEVFHVYLNEFENAVTHLFLFIFGNK